MSEELGNFGDSYRVQFVDQSGYVAKDYSGYLDSSGVLKLGNVNLKGGQYAVSVEGKNGKLTPFKANVTSKPSRINANRAKSPNINVEEEYVNIDLDKLKNERIQESLQNTPQPLSAIDGLEKTDIANEEFNFSQNQKIKIDSVEQIEKDKNLLEGEQNPNSSSSDNSFAKLPGGEQNYNYSITDTDDSESKLTTERTNAKPTLQQISQNANVISSNNYLNKDQFEIQNAPSNSNFNNESNQNQTTKVNLEINLPDNNQVANATNTSEEFYNSNSSSVNINNQNTTEKFETTYESKQNEVDGIQNQIPGQTGTTQNYQSIGQSSAEQNYQNLGQSGTTQNQISGQTINQSGTTQGQIPGQTIEVNQNYQTINRSGATQGQIPGQTIEVNQNYQTMGQSGATQGQTPGQTINQSGATQNQTPGQTIEVNQNYQTINQSGTTQNQIPGQILGTTQTINQSGTTQNQIPGQTVQNANNVNEKTIYDNEKIDEKFSNRLNQNQVFGDNNNTKQSSDVVYSNENTVGEAIKFGSLPEVPGVGKDGIKELNNDTNSAQVELNNSDSDFINQSDKILSNNNLVYNSNNKDQSKDENATSFQFGESDNINQAEYQRLQNATVNNSGSIANLPVSEINRKTGTTNDFNNNVLSNDVTNKSNTEDNTYSNNVEQVNYSEQNQNSSQLQSSDYRFAKLPNSENDFATEYYSETINQSQTQQTDQNIYSSPQNGQDVAEFKVLNNYQQNNLNTDLEQEKITQAQEAPSTIQSKQNEILAKMNESFNKASKTEESFSENKSKQESDTQETSQKLLDDQGNLKRVILESLPQQTVQKQDLQESENLNPRISGFKISADDGYDDDEESELEKSPIRKRIKYITIGGNVIAALQSIDVPQNADAIVNEKIINDQIKQKITDETKPLEDQVYSSLMKERETLQSKLMDLENNKAYLRRAEENIQNQLVYLVANDQMVDNSDSSASSPLNQIIQNFINEDRTTVENFKQETINQAVQAISGQKEIDEILLRQRIERELRYEFNQMQLDHEQKMKIIYRRMIESMYSDLLNS